MSQLVRIIGHWTAGTGRASADDRNHYHVLYEEDGTEVWGTEAPEDNIVISDGDYAAHTLRLNTGSIGVAVCGMHGAKEAPFDPGKYPINERQFRAFAAGIARLAVKYGIPCRPDTILTHAEVEQTLGVKQRGKWDIARLPWRPDLLGARAVGSYLRGLVRAEVQQMGVPMTDDFDFPRPAPRPHAEPLLNMGDRSTYVRRLQEALAGLRYPVGAADGAFGRLTRDAVLAFQADHGLATDGIVGPATWRALDAALPRPERQVSETDLRARGSRTLTETDKATTGVGVGAGIAGVGALIQAVSDGADRLADSAGRLGEAATGFGFDPAALLSSWPTLLIVGGLGLTVCVAWRHRRRIIGFRVEDARTTAHLGR